MINKKWEKKKIEDIFKETYEKNQPNSDVLTIIQGRGTVLREDSGREIIYDKNSLSNYKHVQKNDFIIHLRSFEGGLEIANQDGIVSPAYITLHPKIKIEPGYLYALFHSNQFINQTMAPAVEGARDGRSVKYEVLKKQSIAFPPLPEQRKIAEILTAQDRVIALKEKLVAEKRKQKKFLMQRLLSTDDTRPFKLNGVTIEKGKWEKKLFKKIFEFHPTNTLARNFLTENKQKFKDIHYGDILTKYSSILFVNKTSIPYIKANIDCTKMDLLKSGDIVIADTAEDNTAGKVVEIQEVRNDNIVAGLHTMFCRPVKGLFSPKWLGYYMNSHEYHNQLIPLLTGIKVSSIAKKDIVNTWITIPTLPEQQAIAEVLSAADREISLLQQNLEQERKKKKSLMQLLLSGLVRVNAPEDSHEL